MSAPRVAIDLEGVAIRGRLDRTSLRVLEGERVALLGPNGTGKTTLMRVTAGLAEPDCGARLVVGPIGYVPQDCRASFLPWWSARRNALLAAPSGAPVREREQRLDAWLDALDLPRGLGSRAPHELSGGQLALFALARALLAEPRVLLLDEALAAIDEGRRRVARERILEVVRRDRVTMLFATHDPLDVQAFADRVLVLEGCATEAA